MSGAANWPVSVDPVFGCWLWTGRTDRRDGGALVWRGKHPYAAYRVVFEAEVGDIGAELVLDHLCRRRMCVAPHHLEPVTKDENEKRKMWRYRAKRTTCPRGHALATSAIVTPEGGRVCRECNHEASHGP